MHQERFKTQSGAMFNPLNKNVPPYLKKVPERVSESLTAIELPEQQE